MGNTKKNIKQNKKLSNHKECLSGLPHPSNRKRKDDILPHCISVTQKLCDTGVNFMGRRIFIEARGCDGDDYGDVFFGFIDRFKAVKRVR